MLMLTKEQQKVIEMQMYNKARDIDVAVFNCMAREDFPKMLFTTALSGFQNKDGGFAHALEIDNYNKDSNIIQATEAFRLARLAGFKNMNEDMILADTFKKLFNNLYNRLDKWEAIIPSNNSAICASWYKYNDVNIKRFGDSPTPEILAYTIYFTDSKSPYYKKAMTKIDEACNKFISKNEFTREEIVSYSRMIDLLNEAGICMDKMDQMKNHLIEVALPMIEKENFDSVCLLATDVFFEYTNNDEANKLIDKTLDYLCSSIKPHGLWEAPFDWSGEIGEGATAQIKWIGCITCKNLGILKKFNRIEA